MQSVAGCPRCRVGVTASQAASTSGRPSCRVQPAPRGRQQQHGGAQLRLQQRQQRDCAARVTNTQSELVGAVDQDDLDYIELDRMQIPNPELGPLEQRVEATFEEAIFTDEIRPEDSQYWCTPPEGGWNQTPERVPKAQVVENSIPTAFHPGDGRTPLGNLKEGQELTGVVTCLMLNHGAKVDLGAEIDGLIPVYGEEWTEALLEELDIDAEVRVRIHKIHDDVTLFRWPIQLELLSPAAATLPPPEAHRPRLDLRGRSDLQEVMDKSGRKYTTRRYFTPFAKDDHLDDMTEELIDDEFDEEEEDEEEDEATWADLEPEMLARIADLAIRV